MFENRSEPVLPRPIFYLRLAAHGAIALGLVAFMLGVGMIGYHILEKMSWVDAFVNAAMILSGMGPVSTLQTNAGKIFAGIYALVSGLAFITGIGIVFAPAFHRFLHKFHAEGKTRASK